MNLLGAVIGSALGAAIGGVAWALIAYATGYEIGYVAWGVGLAAGAGAAVGARGSANSTTGVIAALLAVAAILAGKYAVLHMLVKKELSQIQTEFQTMGMPVVEEEEFWTSHVADRLIEEKEAQGERVAWPAGVDPAEAQHEAEYPTDVWADAKARWGAMEADARVRYREDATAVASEQMASFMTNMQSEAMSQGFIESFSLIDVIFGVLAIATAYKVGSASLSGAESA